MPVKIRVRPNAVNPLLPDSNTITVPPAVQSGKSISDAMIR